MYLQFILTVIAIAFVLFLLEVLKIRKLLQGNNSIVKDVPVGEEYYDELLSEAEKLVIKHQKASAVFLQRKLRIGYARAMSLLDTLEENGVIGPYNGSKPREVLKTL